MANTITINTVLTVCLLIHNKRQAGTARPTAIMTSADGIKYFQTLSLSVSQTITITTDNLKASVRDSE